MVVVVPCERELVVASKGELCPKGSLPLHISGGSLLRVEQRVSSLVGIPLLCGWMVMLVGVE